MKKLITGIILLGAVAAQAAFQYEVVSTPTSWAPGVSVYGSEYFVRVTEGSGSLYVLDHINNLYDDVQNESIADNVSAFGYVNLTTGESGAGSFENTITTYEHAMSEWHDVVTQTGYELGTFSAGDEVAIWVTDKTTGYTGATAGQGDSPYVDSQQNWRTWGSQSDILGNTAAQITFYGRSIFFGLTGVEGSGGSTTGQPLPGVLSSLAVGGLLGLIKFGRKIKLPNFA